MMNKQELIKNIKFLAREASQQWPHEEMIELRDVLRGINQLDEPEVLSQELPVIPKYVADWFEENKEHFENRLKSAIKYREINDDPSEFDVWLDNPHNKPLQILGNMFNGYEVEEEQKYNVQLKVRSSFGTVGVFLYKQGDEVLAGNNFKAYCPEKDEFRLTEQEIKNYDERFWPFVEPV